MIATKYPHDSTDAALKSTKESERSSASIIRWNKETVAIKMKLLLLSFSLAARCLLVDGFTTTAPNHVRTKFDLHATVEDETNVMTDKDEEILFGESSYGSSAPFTPMRHRTMDKNGNILADPAVPLNPLDHASDPLINKLRTIRDVIPSCPSLWFELDKVCGDKRALLDEHLCEKKIDVTFSEMHERVKKSAKVFQTLGVKKGTNVAVLGENSAFWLMIDHGIQLAGGVSAVRGADAPDGPPDARRVRANARVATA